MLRFPERCIFIQAEGEGERVHLENWLFLCHYIPIVCVAEPWALGLLSDCYSTQNPPAPRLREAGLTEKGSEACEARKEKAGDVGFILPLRSIPSKSWVRYQPRSAGGFLTLANISSHTCLDWWHYGCARSTFLRCRLLRGLGKFGLLPSWSSCVRQGVSYLFQWMHIPLHKAWGCSRSLKLCYSTRRPLLISKGEWPSNCVMEWHTFTIHNSVQCSLWECRLLMDS